MLFLQIWSVISFFSFFLKKKRQKICLFINEEENAQLINGKSGKNRFNHDQAKTNTNTLRAQTHRRYNIQHTRRDQPPTHAEEKTP
jgi:hypothetical protein